MKYTDEVVKKLGEYGINYPDAMDRMDNNAELYEHLSRHYVTDKNYENFVEAAKNGDDDEAYRYVHTLKGLAGNLSFNELYELAAKACVEYTSGNPAGAGAMIDEIGACDKKVREGLEYWHRLL